MIIFVVQWETSGGNSHATTWACTVVFGSDMNHSGVGGCFRSLGFGRIITGRRRRGVLRRLGLGRTSSAGTEGSETGSLAMSASVETWERPSGGGEDEGVTIVWRVMCDAERICESRKRCR